MDTYLEAIAETLRDHGYVVIPKERVLRMSVSDAMRRDIAEHVTDAADYERYRTGQMGRQLGCEIITSPAVLWDKREDEHMNALVRRAEIRLIIPKEAE